MLGFPIVDSHVHLWDLSRLSYPWLAPPFSDEGVSGSVEAIARTYLLNDYLADAARWDVAKIVHIEAGADPRAALDETRWLQAMADQRGYPQGIIAFAALNDPGVEALLAAHAASSNVRGVRHILNWHAEPSKTYTPRDLLIDDAFASGYALLAKYELSFDLQIYPSQMPAAAKLAGRNERTPMIVNHTGMPVDRNASGLAAWRDGMAALAERPNVSVKISGFGIVDHHWTVERIRPFVLDTIDIFGVDRCMFASDFPTDKLFADFDTVIGAFDTLTHDFSEGERRKLFASNAERIYRLSPQAGTHD
jgi:predicted TIM-barrel fold metal-dependent hydrolase